ncbi:hypothetical protein T06_9514 [Trichinella sp. T6]|nr:hypothetical protein T06_9514 [Trichinella sp. T6]
MPSTLPHEEPPSALHPGKIKWNEITGSLYPLSVRIPSTLYKEPISSSPWQDKVEGSFSLRNHRITLSSQCEDAFYTATRSTTISSSPWQDEMERIFSLRNHRSVLSSQCENAFYTATRSITIGSSPWLDKVERSYGPLYLFSVWILYALPHEELPSALHPGRIKLKYHRSILSSHCGDPFCTAARRTTLSASPWLDKVERSFSLRNHRIILSSQCEEAFYTATRRTTLSSSPWLGKVERSFSLRMYRATLSIQCVDPFCSAAGRTTLSSSPCDVGLELQITM